MASAVRAMLVTARWTRLTVCPCPIKTAGRSPHAVMLLSGGFECDHQLGRADVKGALLIVLLVMLNCVRCRTVASAAAAYAATAAQLPWSQMRLGRSSMINRRTTMKEVPSVTLSSVRLVKHTACKLWWMCQTSWCVTNSPCSRSGRGPRGHRLPGPDRPDPGSALRHRAVRI